MISNPPDVQTYNETVWRIVQQVPVGIVTTFGQIATMIPTPEGVDADDYTKLSPKWVGNAMNAVSFVDEASVPWWRVINAKGGISLPEGSKAAKLQRLRLENEGVQFSKKDLVDLNQYGWDGPLAEWLAEMKLLPPKPIKSKPTSSTTQLSLF